MPSNVPNKPTVDFPSPSIIVNTLLIERSSSFSGTFTPQEPGTPFTPATHSLAEAEAYANAISLGQKAGKDNEFQERAWAPPPQTQDISNYDISYSDENNAYPIFKRRYLELRDLYPTLVRAKNSPFTGLYAVTVTAGGTGYTNKDTVTFTGGGGSGATGIVLTNPTTGAIVKITLKTEGSGYTSAPTVVLPSGSGAAAVAVIQPPTCQLIKEDVVEASEWWNSIYFLVERIYETLDGPVRIDWVQSPEDQVSSELTKQRIATSEVTEPTPSLGVTTTIRHLSHAVSEITEETLDPTQMSNYYRAFVRTGSVNLPPVLLGLNYLWTISQGYGSGSSSGTGFAVGTSVSLTLPASARAQASIGVEPQVQPIWGAYFTEDLPLVDFEFYLPNPATAAEIFTAASAFASAYFGVATTINQWPIWRPDKQNFVMSGKKISMSASAEARVSVSVSESEVSETIVNGSDSNQDVSPSVRPMTLPDCIHGAIQPSGFSSLTASQIAGAGAFVEGGTNFPAAGSGAVVSGTADGYISPASLGATSPTAYPVSGLYGKPNSQTYKAGYDRVVVTTFDFSVLSGGTTPLPQITTINFSATPMSAFVTGGSGLGFILPRSGGITGFWINTGTETQPDFSAFGVTEYAEVDPSIVGTSHASLTTNIGVANADLIYTAVTSGAAGNEITVQYDLTLAPSFTITVSVSGSAIIVTPSTDAGVPQITTATAVGTVTGSGSASIVITAAAGVSGSPVTIPVAVLNGDIPSAWAAKVITAINANGAVSALYTASGTGDSIVLTRNIGHTNDPTLNIAISTGTASGITAAPTSAATQAGVGPAITSTAAQVKTAVAIGASSLVTVALAGGNDGSGVVVGMSAMNLSGGFSQPTPAGIASALQSVIAASYSSTWTATQPTTASVQAVSTATGAQGFGRDIDSGATIQVIQPGQ